MAIMGQDVSEEAMGLSELFDADTDKKDILSVQSDLAELYKHLSAVKVEMSLLDDGISASAKALKIRRRTLLDDHADTKRRMEQHLF
ncbi:unnamed protein product [Cylindrotheca closterium]|uniref:Uncharacterized protein n=1 Tax=Cylindrotheca closterium TaxID=2856 RepID=A0AAD2FID0_9STRA|nr:unnamed protein product [Cylindrotheca closterium]